MLGSTEIRVWGEEGKHGKGEEEPSLQWEEAVAQDPGPSSMLWVCPPSELLSVAPTGREPDWSAGDTALWPPWPASATRPHRSVREAGGAAGPPGGQALGRVTCEPAALRSSGSHPEGPGDTR